MNTLAQTRADDGRNFHNPFLKRNFPELRLYSLSRVHSWWKELVQERLLAHITRSWVKRAVKEIAAPWVAGFEVESRKKKKEDMRTTESEVNVATVLRQRRQKACWYFVTSRINPQAHGYCCSFHPRVFQGIVSIEEHEYAIYGFRLIQGHMSVWRR